MLCELFKALIGLIEWGEGGGTKQKGEETSNDKTKMSKKVIRTNESLEVRGG